MASVLNMTIGAFYRLEGRVARWSSSMLEADSAQIPFLKFMTVCGIRVRKPIPKALQSAARMEGLGIGH